MKNKEIIIVGVLLLVIVIVGVYVGNGLNQSNPLAGVSVSNEYMSTSTALSSIYGAQTADSLLKTGQGSLGSVIITGANTGILNFYDATTTDNDLRTVSVATSSILIVSIPADTVAGTYVFDVEYTTGLFLDLESGNMPTTTVTFR